MSIRSDGAHIRKVLVSRTLRIKCTFTAVLHNLGFILLLEDTFGQTKNEIFRVCFFVGINFTYCFRSFIINAVGHKWEKAR